MIGTYAITDFIMFSDSVYGEMLREYRDSILLWGYVITLVGVSSLWISRHPSFFLKVWCLQQAISWFVVAIFFYASAFVHIASYSHFLTLLALCQMVLFLFLIRRTQEIPLTLPPKVVLTLVLFFPLEDLLLLGELNPLSLMGPPQPLNLGLSSLVLLSSGKWNRTVRVVGMIVPLLVTTHFGILWWH